MLVPQTGCVAGVFVVCGWCVCGVSPMCVWCVAGVWVVCCWCVCGVLLVCAWCDAVLTLKVSSEGSLYRSVRTFHILIFQGGVAALTGLLLEQEQH